MGSYSATKKNETSSHEKAGMNIKCMWLNEINQGMYCIIPVMWPS